MLVDNRDKIAEQDWAGSSGKRGRPFFFFAHIPRALCSIFTNSIARYLR